jgi:hypothetical protein
MAHKKQLDVRYIEELGQFAFYVDPENPVWLMSQQEALDMAESLTDFVRSHPPRYRYDIFISYAHDNDHMRAILDEGVIANLLRSYDKDPREPWPFASGSQSTQ